MIALLVLLCVELVSFGTFSSQIGFYHDDWSMLEMARPAGNAWEVFKIFAGCGTYWSRPVEILQFSAFYILGGLDPAVYQILLLGFEVAQGLLFFVFLNRLSGSRRLALMGAALALMCPNRAVTHIWLSASGQTLALVLVLGSLVSHLEWLASRKIRWLLGSQSLFLLSVLCYESVAFMPLMLAGGLWIKKKSLRDMIKDMLPYVPTLFVALSWQWVGIKLLLDGSNPKSLGFSAGHLFKVYGAGFECLTNRVIDACWKAVPALTQLGLKLLALGTVFTLLATALLSAGTEDASKKSLKIALGIALGGFVGSYAPYALSSTYMPQIFGIMSRTNGCGALIAGLLWAMGVCALRQPTAQRALLALIVAAFTWTNWDSSSQWAQSWTLQKDILGKAARHAEALPDQSIVLLTGAPGFIGKALVFDAHWDFAPALRLTTNRKDLSGSVASPRLSFDENGAAEPTGDGNFRRYPYGNLYLFDYNQDTMTRVEAPQRPRVL